MTAPSGMSRVLRPISTTCANPKAPCISRSASPRSRGGEILALDLAAVRAVPGVVAVLTAEDVRGKNDVSRLGR